MKKTAIHILLSVTVLFLTILVTVPSIHNHAPDLVEHNECLGYLLLASMSGALAALVVLLIFALIYLSILLLSDQANPQSLFPFSVENRAPPVL